ncbi:non-ribosomal peptide synthetase [Flavobacterium pectinovorum]|uniref:Non-ribosomal peptide synthetase component F n=1 Tax=Flavobacterium pectinovorum TaxID=29533 RepID=A0AB36P6M6_9FLAO|nr:condensation domain-containing protein [Flavobacterium pectinovorum]OXB08226.1 hypothetical protein B0A72_00265 [Flavobacterium pectinovorum]SHN14692.1 Non-ribosomal peptide synthetase component F [Flavobacterium pectinovorum]
MELKELLTYIEENNIDVSLNESYNLNIVLNKKDAENKTLIDSIRSNKEHLIKHLETKNSESLIPVYRMTPFQEGLAGFVKNNPDSSRYIIHLTFKSEKEIDFDAFKKACGLLVSSNEILKSSFDYDSQEQVFKSKIIDTDEFFCEQILPQDEQSFRQGSFDISKESLIKFALIDKHIIIIKIHHIIADVVSVQLMLQQLFGYYSRFQNNVTPEALQSVPFSEYTKWLLKQNKEKGLSYWKNLLENYDATPIEQIVPVKKNLQETYGELNVSYDLNIATQEMLKNNKLTSNTVINFLFGMVFSKYFRNKKFVWGNTITHRYMDHDNFRDIIGPMITTIPVANDFEKQETIMKSISDFHYQLLDSREYSYISTPEIYEAINAKNLFSANVSFQDVSENNNDTFNDVGIERLVSESQSISHFPLSILASAKKDKISFSISYRSDIFSEDIIKDMTDIIMGLYNNLENIAELKYSELDIFEYKKDIERSVIAGDKFDQKNVSLQKLFTEALGKYKEKTAIEDIEDNSLTFAELDAQSNHIANQLIAKNIKGAVGVHLKYSTNLVVSILGILKAGCTVISLEHGYPIEQLNLITLETDLQACIISSEEKTLFGDRLPYVKENCTLIHISDHIPSEDNLIEERESLAEDILSIYYTSGSTGIPKIVKVSNENTLNGLLYLLQNYPANAQDIFCLNIRVSFSPSVRNILEAIIQGNKIVILPEYLYHNIDKFVETVSQKEISRLSLTPSFIRLLIENDKESFLNKLNFLEVRGEAISMEDMTLFKKLMPATKIVSRYGSTEASSTAYNEALESNLNTSSRYFALGKPIHNTVFKIIDDSSNVLPSGIIGEIYVESKSVAQGYIGTTNNNFIYKDGQISGLKTGDLGYIDQEGILQFIGRKDSMLKLRGYRIEPEEIELAMEKFEGIMKAKIVPVDVEDPTMARLVAFCHVKKVDEFTDINLKHFLKDMLPNYMIPNKILFLDEFPRTSTGKIDIQSLKRQINVTDKNRTETNSMTEQRIKDIFTDIMPSSVIYIDEEFFEMGVNSILTMKAAYKLSTEFNISLKGAELFQHDTIEKLAVFIDTMIANKNFKREEIYHTLNQNDDNEDIFFLIPPLTGTSLFNTLRPFMQEDIDFYVFETIAVEEYPQLAKDLETLAGFYKNSILQMYKGKRIHMGGWSFGGSTAFEIALQLQALGVEVSSLVLLDPNMYRPEFDSDNKQREDYEKIIRALLIQENIDPDSIGMHKFIEQAYHSNYVIKNYRPASIYKGDIALIKPELTSEFERNHDTPYNGFREYCEGEIKISFTPGNHMTMATGPAKVVANLIFSNLNLKVK